MGSLKFFIDPFGPGIDIDSSSNVYQEYFLEGKGDRCVRLTTLPPSCADCLEIRKSLLELSVYGLLFRSRQTLVIHVSLVSLKIWLIFHPIERPVKIYVLRSLCISRSNNLYRCQVRLYLNRQLASGFTRFIRTGIWSHFKIIEHLGHICVVILFITTKHRDLWLPKKSNCKKTECLVFWTVKYVCTEPYFRSSLTEGIRAVVSLLKPHTS